MEHFDLFKSVVLPYTNFLVFVFLAWWLFRKPVKEALKKQHEEYYHSIHAANEALKIAEKSQIEIQSRLDSLDKSIEEIKGKIGVEAEVGYESLGEIQEKAKLQAEVEREHLLVGANNLARQMKLEAERIAQVEIENAREQLKKEILALSKEKVLERIGSELNEDSHRKISQKKLEQLNSLNLEG